MNSGQPFQVFSDSSCSPYQPSMAKLASMKPMFPTDPNALAKFEIPDDSYYRNIPSASKPLRNGSNSPRNLKLYNSFDIYGNEIQMSNANRMAVYQDEAGGSRRGLQINKENQYQHPVRNNMMASSVKSSEGEGSGLNRNPLVNITPVVPLKKTEERNTNANVNVEKMLRNSGDKLSSKKSNNNLTKLLR